MKPWCSFYGTFCINQQNITRFGIFSLCCSECLKSSMPRSACHNPPSYPFLPGHSDQALKKDAEPLTKKSFGIFRITSAFNVEPNLFYHRVPPTSPILHSSPKGYLSSQSLSFLGFNRLSVVLFWSRSQIKTLSDLSVKAETRTSE